MIIHVNIRPTKHKTDRYFFTTEIAPEDIETATNKNALVRQRIDMAVNGLLLLAESNGDLK